MRQQEYEVIENGRSTGKIVYSYDPEEYEEHTIVFPEKGKPDRSITSRWFRCDICKEKFPIQEYMDSWDWGGPHCPNSECDNGGVELFAKREGPIRNAKGLILYEMKKAIEVLEKILGKTRDWNEFFKSYRKKD